MEFAGRGPRETDLVPCGSTRCGRKRMVMVTSADRSGSCPRRILTIQLGLGVLKTWQEESADVSNVCSGIGQLQLVCLGCTHPRKSDRRCMVRA